MRRTAWLALFTILAFGTCALAQAGGSSGGGMTGTTAGGTAAAPAGTSATPGVATGSVNPATGSNTGSMGNMNIGTQALNPNNGPIPAMSGATPLNTGQQVLPGQPNLVNGVNGVGFGSNAGGGFIVGTPMVNISGNVAPSPVGASNATPGLQAGATNSTLLQGGVPAGSVMSQDAYTYNPGAVAMPINASGGAPNPAANAGAYYAGAIFNTGAAEFGPGGGASAENIAQIAREFRQKKNTQNARVYTNQDLERLAQQPTTGFEANGVSGQGANAYMQGAGANQAQQGCAVGGTAGAASNCAAGQNAQSNTGAIAAPPDHGAVYQAPPATEQKPNQQPPNQAPPSPPK